MKKTLLMLTAGLSLLLIGLVLGSEFYEPVAGSALEDGNHAAVERPAQRQRAASPGAGAAEVPGPAPEPQAEDAPAIKPVRFGVAPGRRVDPRERMGLPPVMRSLARANRYRPPTGVELSDPVLLERYKLEREIHGAYWVSRHELEEAGRFRAEADRTRDPARRELLLKVAMQHEVLAERGVQKQAELEQQRVLYQ